MTRRWLAAAVAAATVVLTPGTAMAVPLLQWALEMSPSTVPENQSTTFTLTATNALLSLRPLGCVEVDLPPSFAVEGVGTPIASNGQSWSSSSVGQAVFVQSNTTGGRLGLLGSVTFTIQARPTAPGSFTWPNHAHITIDCGADEVGTPLDVTVSPAPTPTPSPSPSPSPNPTPSPSPTPSLPLPSLPLPSLPLPSLPLPSLPLPTVPQTPHSTPTHSPSPAPTSAASRPGESATPEPTLTPGAGGPPRGAPPSQPPGSDGDPLGAVRLAPETGRGYAGLGVDLKLGNLLADMHVWSVPAVAIGVPGLLLIVWVALQTAGVLAWIPAVRRMRGDDCDRRHLRRH